MNLLLTALLAAAMAFAVISTIRLYRYRKAKGAANFTDDQYSDEVMDLRLENKKLKEDLRTARMLSRLVRQSPNAIMVMDADGNIQMLNEGFTRMYGYTFEEFTSKLGSNYRQTSFSSDVQRRLDYVAEHKEPFRYEALNITRDGREIWTQTALMPILDDEGNITSMVTIDTDIDTRINKSDRLIDEMEDLNSEIDRLSQQFKFLENEFSNLFDSINDLYQLIEKTDQILKFIKDISDETRILGFNASIEAARAGEHGKGFRVITNEIIEISHNTIYSIDQINEILDSIKAKQEELIGRKEESEGNIEAFDELFEKLKLEVKDIENAIAEFKSLA